MSIEVMTEVIWAMIMAKTTAPMNSSITLKGSARMFAGACQGEGRWRASHAFRDNNERERERERGVFERSDWIAVRLVTDLGWGIR